MHPLFQVHPVFETIAVDANATFKFYFSPVLTPDIPAKFFEGTPPYEEIVEVNCIFKFYDQEHMKALTLHGSIIPPAIQFDNTDIQLNQIYIGERQSFSIQVSNVGVIPGKIRLLNISSNAYLTVPNNELSINPDETEKIYVQYFGKEAGKFVDILTFKVGYGPTVEVNIR